MYKITIRQGEGAVSYKEESMTDVMELMRILLFDNSHISVTVMNCNE